MGLPAKVRSMVMGVIVGAIGTIIAMAGMEWRRFAGSSSLTDEAPVPAAEQDGAGASVDTGAVPSDNPEQLLPGAIPAGVADGNFTPGPTERRRPHVETTDPRSPACSTTRQLSGVVETLLNSWPLVAPQPRLGASRQLLRADRSRYSLDIRVSPLTPDLRLANHIGVDGGVTITALVPGTPGIRSGLQVGDILLSVGGRRVTCAHDIQSAVRSLPARTRQPLEIVRGGWRMTLYLEPPSPTVI